MILGNPDAVISEVIYGLRVEHVGEENTVLVKKVGFGVVKRVGFFWVGELLDARRSIKPTVIET